MDSEQLPDLATRLAALCLERGLSISTAESCTGGLIAKTLTDLPGSSDWFRGGIAAYSNEAKMVFLGVREEELVAHGAVSAQVARSMAVGLRTRLKADLAVSVTGISGPGGGTRAKPVGLAYVAVADDLGADVRRFVWTGDRTGNRESGARAALELLIERIFANAALSAKPSPSNER